VRLTPRAEVCSGIERVDILPYTLHLQSERAEWGEAANGHRFSRAQGRPTNQDDNHAKYLSQKARVFGVGWKRMLGACSLVMRL